MQLSIEEPQARKIARPHMSFADFQASRRFNPDFVPEGLIESEGPCLVYASLAYIHIKCMAVLRANRIELRGPFYLHIYNHEQWSADLTELELVLYDWCCREGAI